MFNFIKERLPINEDGKPAIVIDMFSIMQPTIARDQRARSVSLMFNRINENIESLATEKVHTVILINRNDCDSLKFKDLVPFSNIIFY